MRVLAAILCAAVLAACGFSESDPIHEAVTPSTPSTPPSTLVPPSPLDDDPSRPGRTHVSFSFDELDLNDDGAIARTESAFDAHISNNFNKIDKDGDGKLSRLEFDHANR